MHTSFLSSVPCAAHSAAFPALPTVISSRGFVAVLTAIALLKVSVASISSPIA